MWTYVGIWAIDKPYGDRQVCLFRQGVSHRVGLFRQDLLPCVVNKISKGRYEEGPQGALDDGEICVELNFVVDENPVPIGLMVLGDAVTMNVDTTERPPIVVPLIPEEGVFLSHHKSVGVALGTHGNTPFRDALFHPRL